MKHVTAVAAWGAAAAGSGQTAAAAGGSVTGAGLRARPRLRERCRSRCRSRSRAWHARWHVRDALLREQTGRGSEEARAPAGSWQMLLASAARAWPRSLGPCRGTTVWGGAQRGGFKEEKTEREAARPGGWRAPPGLGLAPPAVGSERAVAGAVCACAPVSRCLSCPPPLQPAEQWMTDARALRPDVAAPAAPGRAAGWRAGDLRSGLTPGCWAAGSVHRRVHALRMLVEGRRPPQLVSGRLSLGHLLGPLGWLVSSAAPPTTAAWSGGCGGTPSSRRATYRAGP